MSWCTTCGKDTPERVTECADCRKWRESNPPPIDDAGRCEKCGKPATASGTASDLYNCYCPE